MASENAADLFGPHLLSCTFLSSSVFDCLVQRLTNCGGKPMWSNTPRGDHAPPSVSASSCDVFLPGAGHSPAGLGTRPRGAYIGALCPFSPRSRTGRDTDLPFDRRGSVPSSGFTPGPLFENSDPRMSPRFDTEMLWSSSTNQDKW